MESRETTELDTRLIKRLRRIMYLAGNGFYQSLSIDNRHINWYFLVILKEAYKALNEYLNSMNNISDR